MFLIICGFLLVLAYGVHRYIGYSPWAAFDASLDIVIYAELIVCLVWLVCFLYDKAFP